MDYAAVVSLVQTIHRLLNPSESKIHLPPTSQLEFISDELSHLKSFLEKTRYEPSSKRVVERGVRDAAKKLEDLIDYHLSDPSLPAGADPDGRLTLLLSQHLPKVTQQITTCFTQTSKADHNSSLASDDNVKTTTEKKKIVGFEKQLHQLKFMVLSPIDDLQVIPVVGMAGIGKTTLVQEIYNDPFVTGDFEHCLFLQIGPQSQLEDILRRALLQLHVDHSDKIVSVEELRDSLHRALYHVKYLLVLEDIWDTGLWDMLKQNLPNTYSGSRIIITTQIISLARYASTHGTLDVPFLTDDQSWVLLRETVFTGEEQYCSPQLEKIGKKIAKKCEGLPSAILQVGELLRKIEKTVEKWEEIAEKEDPIAITTDDNTPLSKALSLSYRMVPQYLKVCFLYMAVFPKHYEVTTSKLIQLWVSEGFVEPQTGLSLEEIGAQYLETLVSRNVVLNDKLSSIDVEKTKTCKLHFTFRNICASEAKNERLFPIIKKYNDTLAEDIASQHRLCIHNSIVTGFEQVHEWMESAPDVRSVLCFGPRQQYPTALYLRFRLLKVLDALAIRFYEFPYQVLGLFHLRYLAIRYDGDQELPASISCLWNLEVLIVHRHHIIIPASNFPVYLPMEIWKLHKLKHLECMGFDLPDPTADNDSLILEKLLTIMGVSPASCTRGVLTRIPNLAGIGIKIVSAHDSAETFSFFGDFASVYEEFRSFKCVVINPNLLLRPQIVNFPVNVKKITLSGCAFPWEYMRVIAALPNLQVLKLRWYAFCGAVWSMSENDFPKLKFLLLEDLDIQHWESENRHLPSLESLIIRNCYNLETMPSHVEYCANLKLIEVVDCSDYATSWTLDIQDYCQQFGLDHLQLCITSSLQDKKPQL